MRALCIVFAILLAALPGSPTRAEPGLHPHLADGQVITGATNQRMLHLTFDDGPDNTNTPRLLDTLDRLKIKATFFFSASRFRGQQKRNQNATTIAKDALRRGHSVGSHSVDHQRMGRLSPQQLREQLDENDRLFVEVFGARTYLFRPPFGSTNRHLNRLLHERHYTNVLWNIGLADWVKRPAEAVAKTFDKILERNEKRDGHLGGVVLLHDTHPWTVDAVEPIVQSVRRRNCDLLVRGQPLYVFTGDLTPFHRPAGRSAPGTKAEPIVTPVDAATRLQAAAVRHAQATCPAAAAPGDAVRHPNDGRARQPQPKTGALRAKDNASERPLEAGPGSTNARHLH